MQEISVDENWADKSLVDETRAFAFSARCGGTLFLFRAASQKARKTQDSKMYIIVRLFR